MARFQREPLHKQSNKVNNKGTNNVNHGAKCMTNSYAHVVKGNQVQNVGMEECPNMVLDETCLNHEDFLLCFLGKVKEFASLTNLKVVLGKEGYANIELKYMGGFWVMIVFQDDETKKRFQFNLAVGSWFSQIIQAHNDFGIDERVIWVEVEGVPCESDREEVPETNFEEVHDKVSLKETLLGRMMFILRIRLVFMRKMEYAWDNMFMNGWRFQMTHMSPHVLDILRS
nr:nucleotide-binding alpha-beta plait domain-containing protein [Tanacetum cinerariifolium]